MRITSVHLNGDIFFNPQTNQTVLDTPVKVLVALVWDKQTNGAQLNSEDVFTNPGGIAGLAASTFRNLQYSKRFDVLWKKVFTFNTQVATYDGTNVETGGAIRNWVINKRVNIPVEFKATTAGVSSVVDNSLHVVAFASDVESAPSIRYNARIRFVG